MIFGSGLNSTENGARLFHELSRLRSYTLPKLHQTKYKRGTKRSSTLIAAKAWLLETRRLMGYNNSPVLSHTHTASGVLRVLTVWVRDNTGLLAAR